MEVVRKQAGGREKMEMKKKTNENGKKRRRIAFSKRRQGLFKKASELCTLSGAEVAIVIFSPGGKPFSFGHPTVDSVVARFLHQNYSRHSATSSCHEPHELSQELHELNKYLEAERKLRSTMWRRMISTTSTGSTTTTATTTTTTTAPYSSMTSFRAYVSELGLIELQQLKLTMERLRKKVDEDVMMLEASSKLLTQEVNDLSNVGKNESTGADIPRDWLSL